MPLTGTKKRRKVTSPQTRSHVAQLTSVQRALASGAPNHIICFAQAPVLVRGLDRHLGLREAAQRLDAERRTREERAFLLHPRGPPAPHTVPQPFELATEVGPDPGCTLAICQYSCRQDAACSQPFPADHPVECSRMLSG